MKAVYSQINFDSVKVKGIVVIVRKRTGPQNLPDLLTILVAFLNG